MVNRFGSVALMPICIVLGLALGVQLSGGIFPSQSVGQAIAVIVSAWLAMVLVEMVYSMFSESILHALNYREAEDGQQGELTILLIRDGEVVGKVNSWDKPIPRQQAEYWGRKMAKLLTHQTKVKGA